MLLEDRARLRSRPYPAFVPPSKHNNYQEATHRDEGDRIQHWVESLQDTPRSEEEEEYSEQYSRYFSHMSSPNRDTHSQRETKNRRAVEQVVDSGKIQISKKKVID